MARSSGPRRRSVRYDAITVLLCAAFLVLAGNLVKIQVFDAPVYAEAAAEQYSRDLVIPPKRGTIHDREGEPLAVSVEARSIYAVPSAVEDPRGCAEALASVLGGDVSAYERKLASDRSFVYIARKVDMDIARTIESMGLRGIHLTEDTRRVYPSNELACQVIGFVGVDDEGLSGLEKHYDDLLKGTPGRLIVERGPGGIPIPGGVEVREEPVDGSDVVLTIDKDIQYHAQLELARTVERWRAKAGSIIVMDPRTGAVLAMASVPGFNPNRFTEFDERSFRNRPVVDTYEPGSTIKSFTAAAVIEEGLCSADTTFTLPPTVRVGGRTIHEAHPRSTVTWSLRQIVTNSSNVGSVMLGQMLGKERLYEYFARFGLTERTGVDFPGDRSGYLPPPNEWSASSIGTIPFGQGISVTALQLARALAVIANGGELVTPHLLQAVVDDQDATHAWPKRRVLSERTAAVMRDVLADVVTEGTGAAAKVPGYRVAGKTGTAQKPRTDGIAGYAKGAYVASFSGFLPADDPTVLIVVTIDEPRGAIYGGTVAAPAFSSIGRFCMTHLRIPPSSSTPRSTDATRGAETTVTAR